MAKFSKSFNVCISGPQKEKRLAGKCRKQGHSVKWRCLEGFVALTVNYTLLLQEFSPMLAFGTSVAQQRDPLPAFQTTFLPALLLFHRTEYFKDWILGGLWEQILEPLYFQTSFAIWKPRCLPVEMVPAGQLGSADTMVGDSNKSIQWLALNR